MVAEKTIGRMRQKLRRARDEVIRTVCRMWWIWNWNLYQRREWSFRPVQTTPIHCNVISG